MMLKKYSLIATLFLIVMCNAFGQRETVSFDDNWSFAFGHARNKSHDFNTGTSYFTYLAKARYGADGAAAMNYDHRSWRPVNLPHDWAVEMPFSKDGSHSHGYKAVGPGFPEVSVGWYRKSFNIDEADLGKEIFLDFDGVSRDSKVWVNGHYMGNEASGYQSFSYNITDILNYGGSNSVAVRADVSMEEGWYYEGAGIYRHVWLRKTPQLHIPKNGVFVYSSVMNNKANIGVDFEVVNKGSEQELFQVRCTITNGDDVVLTKTNTLDLNLDPMTQLSRSCSMTIDNPHLWNLDDPYLHHLKVEILQDGVLIDEYATKFGIRTIRFDADRGFFLNNRHVKLKGTNNHQDHAGVGCAMPDALIRWRVQQLKAFGSNAIRSSHNPPTPELLQACDELGVLVIDENRLMGTTDQALSELERLIRRDRNHPSVIVWSIGNEEWQIEGTEVGARMTETMQNFAKTIDPTRPVNVAVSGGWGVGSSTTVEVMGFNYLVHGNTDDYHREFPNTPCIGTEEGSTYTTRGVYSVDDDQHYKTAYDVKPLPDWFTIQECWKHYDARDYLAGMFIWTGFDYRGEPTPYAWPSVTSYFGMMDLCGFPKDNVYYLKSWWQKEETVLHILPHWNWKSGDTIDVWVYSNCDAVDLQLNGQSLGKQTMAKNGHLSWNVPFEAGSLKAIGYKAGIVVSEAERHTAFKAQHIQLSADRTLLNGEKDVAMVQVELLDEYGHAHPLANNDISFEVVGPGQIIGLGNGDPTSLEKDVFVDEYHRIDLPDTELYSTRDNEVQKYMEQLPRDVQEEVIKNQDRKLLISSFTLEQKPSANTRYTLFYKDMGDNQQLFINGHLIDRARKASKQAAEYLVSSSLLSEGKNVLLVVTHPFQPAHQWDHPNRNPGTIQCRETAEIPHRKLFNGLAQVIVQAEDVGFIQLKASGKGLKDATLTIEVK